jgi:hypothetical protein
VLSEVPSRPRLAEATYGDDLIADGSAVVDTPSMTLKGAALLALVGTLLITALLLAMFVSNVLFVVRGVQPPVVLIPSFIYAFGCLTVTVFFFQLYRSQR